MNIAGILGYSSESLYNSAAKGRLAGTDQEFLLDGKSKEKASGSANSAQSAEKITGTTVNNSTTASTLWQTQNIAQSPESDAIDVEIDDASDKKTEQSAADKFLDYMDKTPEELMRDSILKELGYTEEDLQAMDPKTRAKVEAKIEELMKIKVEESMRKNGVDIDSANKIASNDTQILALA